VTERNAIRIIEMCGYPQEVVREAYRLVGKGKM
jgi:DNA mismatch repair ATPase MutS